MSLEKVKNIVTDQKRTIAALACIAAALTATFLFLQQGPGAFGQVTPGAGVVINITVYILNAPPEIVWVEWPQEIPFNTNVTVNFRIRDNNTLWDVDASIPGWEKPPPFGWVGFQYRFPNTDWVNCTVTGPFDVLWVPNPEGDMPWEGTYKGTFKLPLVPESAAHLRAIVIDDNGTMAMSERIVTTYQFLSMKLLEGGTQSFVLPPGEMENFTVKLNVKANFATELLAFYPGGMEISINGTKVGIIPLNIANIVAADQTFTFIVNVKAPVPYPVNLTVHSVYLIGKM